MSDAEVRLENLLADLRRLAADALDGWRRGRYVVAGSTFAELLERHDPTHAARAEGDGCRCAERAEAAGDPSGCYCRCSDLGREGCQHR